MIWHYACPLCADKISVEWEDHRLERKCPYCRKKHYPPAPSQDYTAYIGGDQWPPEFEEIVTELRGTTCEVPGCFHSYETLVLRKPASLGGRISVDNLMPFCNSHARLKGEQDYHEWLQGLTPEQRSGPPERIKFDITKQEPVSPDVSAISPLSGPALAGTKSIYPLAAGARLSGMIPPNLTLVTAQPFPLGVWQTLVLYYCCALNDSRDCRVFLAAWPRDRVPDWSQGIERARVVYASGHHSVKAPVCEESQLALDLSGTIEQGLWIAAVFVESLEGKAELTDYLLAGMEQTPEGSGDQSL